MKIEITDNKVVLDGVTGLESIASLVVAFNYTIHELIKQMPERTQDRSGIMIYETSLMAFVTTSVHSMAEEFRERGLDISEKEAIAELSEMLSRYVKNTYK